MNDSFDGYASTKKPYDAQDDLDQLSKFPGTEGGLQFDPIDEDAKEEEDPPGWGEDNTY